MKKGIIFRWGSCWIGAHWSPANRRLCINLVPCMTFWFVGEGGYTPDGKWVPRTYPIQQGASCQRCGRCREGDFAHCKARR